MAAFDGKFVIVKIGGQSLLGQTSSSLSFEADMLETTDKLSKDSTSKATFRTYIGGHKNATLEVSGNTDTGANGWTKLFDLWTKGLAEEKATIIYADERVGGKNYAVDGLLMSLSRDDSDNSISTFTASFQVTGKPAETTTT